MLALIGEKNVRIFPTATQRIVPFTVTHADFFENFYKNTNSIIVDGSFCEFHLDRLRNINIYEAIECLQCRKKNIDNSESVYIVQEDNSLLNVIRSHNFSIQAISFKEQKFFQQISSRNIYIIENAVCELCKTVTNIDNWWLYVGQHQSSGLKIVGGFGNGIVYTRCFDDQNEIERKVIETLKFMVREGADEKIKIISFVDDLYIDDLNIYTPQINKKDIEYELIKIIISDRISPNFFNNNFMRRFLKKIEQRIIIFLIFIICVLLPFLGHLYDCSVELENDIEAIEEDRYMLLKDKSGGFSAKISKTNMNFIEELAEIFKKIKSPIKTLKKTSDFLIFHKITAEKITFEPSINEIRIKCFISKEKIDEIAKIKTNDAEVTTNVMSKSENEYEELNDDNYQKKYGAEVCIKMK